MTAWPHTYWLDATLHLCLQPSDEYGSPTLDEIAVFSQQFSDEYHKAMGEVAEDVAVEVSSPVSSNSRCPAAELLQLHGHIKCSCFACTHLMLCCSAGMRPSRRSVLGKCIFCCNRCPLVEVCLPKIDIAFRPRVGYTLDTSHRSFYT